MNDKQENGTSLYELLVKTSYQTQITEPHDLECSNPIGFGSGFIVVHSSAFYFVTADHTVHLDDYNNGQEERTWKDYVVSIFNNYTPPENFLSTVITPLGGFYYLEAFRIDKPSEVHTPVDIAVCKMKQSHFQFPFLTDEVRFESETIEFGEHKFFLKKECFNEPKLEKVYFIFGKIRTKIADNIRLVRENTLKEGLQFISQTGDYLLFNTKDEIEDETDWEGLSGSPVLSEDGECVGVLCSVNENTKSVWVMTINKVRMLIEVIAHQENDENRV